jgi:hypothetical protein
VDPLDPSLRHIMEEQAERGIEVYYIEKPIAAEIKASFQAVLPNSRDLVVYDDALVRTADKTDQITSENREQPSASKADGVGLAATLYTKTQHVREAGRLFRALQRRSQRLQVSAG